MVYNVCKSIMEIACTDEVKVYKDEGEEEEQKKSSENLTEDKVGLVIEGEGQCSPKHAFNFGFVSLSDYYHSLLPLPFTRGSPFSQSATSPYAVAAAAAAYGAACARAAAVAAAAASRRVQLSPTRDTSSLRTCPNADRKLPLPFPTSSSAASLLHQTSFASGSHNRGSEDKLKTCESANSSPVLLPSSLTAFMHKPLFYNQALQSARSPNNNNNNNNSTSSGPAWSKTTPDHSVDGAESDFSTTSSAQTSSTVAAVAAFHSELLKAANLYGLKASGFKTESSPSRTELATSPLSPLASTASLASFGGRHGGAPVPFLGNWANAFRSSSSAFPDSGDNSTNGLTPEGYEHACRSTALNGQNDFAAAAVMLRGCLSNTVSPNAQNFVSCDIKPPSLFPSPVARLADSETCAAAAASVQKQARDYSAQSPLQFNPTSPRSSQRAAVAAAAAAAAHVRLLSSLAAVAASQQSSAAMRSGQHEDNVVRTSSYSAMDLLSDSDRASANDDLPVTQELPTTLKPDPHQFRSNTANSSTFSASTTCPHSSPLHCSSGRLSASDLVKSELSSPRSDNPRSPVKLFHSSIITSTGNMSSSSSACSLPTAAGVKHTTGASGSSKRVHIKKPLNAFMLFMKDMRPRVQEECTLKESAAINQILGRKWHELPREKQAKYYEMARKEKELHHQLFPGWSARDNYAMHSRRKKKRRLAAAMVAANSRYSFSGDSSSSITTTRERGDDERSNSVGGILSNTAVGLASDFGSAKKCRARFGLEHQHRWCKPCRRKKKCIRFMTDAEFEESERRSCSSPLPSTSSASTIPMVTPVHKTFGVPTVFTTPESVTFRVPSSFQSLHESLTSNETDLWSCYVPNLPANNSKSTSFHALHTTSHSLSNSTEVSRAGHIVHRGCMPTHSTTKKSAGLYDQQVKPTTGTGFSIEAVHEADSSPTCRPSSSLATRGPNSINHPDHCSVNNSMSIASHLNSSFTVSNCG